jgi:TP53 regulating kinase and related kinases
LLHISQKVWETQEVKRNVIVKHRFSKSYRLPELDRELTLSRLRQEVRSILRARKLGIRAPTLIRVNLEDSCIIMEKIEGLTMKEALLHDSLLNDASKISVLEELGSMIGKLHDGDLIHGDLTTSNVMITIPAENGTSNVIVSLIDFGLSQFSQLSEDKAVDLYVLERSFSSAHPVDGEEMFASFLTSYRKSSRKWCSTLNRLAEVRLRGRKRSMVG